MPPVSPATGKAVQPGEIGAFVLAEPSGTEIGAYWHLTGGNIYTAGAWRHVGTLDSTGDVVAAGISVQGHEHGEVQKGSDTTGKPVPGSAS
jgi:phage baseplate assembly protein gpV